MDPLSLSHKAKVKEPGMTERNKMEQTKMVDWEIVGSVGKFVNLVRDERKSLAITGWTLQKTNRWGDEQLEFTATVLKENGVDCDKEWTTTSKRLMNKLKPFLKDKSPEEIVRLSVKKLGSQYDTTYDVELV